MNYITALVFSCLVTACTTTSKQPVKYVLPVEDLELADAREEATLHLNRLRIQTLKNKELEEVISVLTSSMEKQIVKLSECNTLVEVHEQVLLMGETDELEQNQDNQE